MSVSCFIFLGNPGREYENTRHNIGWKVADQLERNYGINLVWLDKFDGKLAVQDTSSHKIFWFKPQCFMNLSGNPVRKLIDFYKISIKNVLVVHDELELSFGEIAFKQGGGAGGHNGLRSIDNYLGNSAYQRCRIGIGRPKHGDVSSFVLARFSKEEEISLPLILDSASQALQEIIRGNQVPTNKIQAFQSFTTSKKGN